VRRSCDQVAKALAPIVVLLGNTGKIVRTGQGLQAVMRERRFGRTFAYWSCRTPQGPATADRDLPRAHIFIGLREG
jgi:hypothetical protein